MFLENNILAFVLKKQSLNEADELITFYTLEQGKVRALAKSSKSPKSKLQHALQVPFLVELRLSQNQANLPIIIGARVVNHFEGLRQDLFGIKIVYSALDLILKFTVEGQVNREIYNLFNILLLAVSSHRAGSVISGYGEAILIKFKIDLAGILGVKIKFSLEAKYFSNSRGGFFVHRESNDCQPIDNTEVNNFATISQTAWQDMGTKKNLINLHLLQTLLSNFLEYHMERKLKAEKTMELVV